MQEMEKAVITVLGQDRVGITARVCTTLAESNINILDISQTIVDGYFNMVMVVDITNTTNDFEGISAKFDALGNEMGLKIRVQHSKIFDAMHRV